MADKETVSAISGLSKVTEKMAADRQAETDKAKKDRTDRMDVLNATLKEAKKNKTGRSSEAVAARSELKQIKKATAAAKVIQQETSRSTQAALGISEDELRFRQEQSVLLSDQAKALEILGEGIKSAGGSLEKNEEYQRRSVELQAAQTELTQRSLSGIDLEKDQLRVMGEQLTKLGEGIKSAGGSLEKNEEYQRRSVELQAAQTELTQRSLSGMDLQKDQLRVMEEQLTKGTSVATDSKEYNKLNYQIQKAELADRLKNATSPAARKEIRAEQAALAKKQGGLLGKIAGGIQSLKQQGLDKLKSVGKGAMALLKGTLIAGMLVALVAFLDSDMWKKMKETLIGAIEKLGKVWDAFGEKGFIGGIKELFGKFGGWTIAIGALVATMVGVFAVKTLLAPLTTAFKLVKGLFGGVGKGVGKLLGKGAAKAGAGSAAKMAGGAPGKAGAGNAGKAFGQVIGNIGKGLGKGIEGILRGLAMGLLAFQNPMILLGAAILAGSIVVIGAGIAGAVAIIATSLPLFAKNMKEFENLDGKKLLTVAKGIGAIGLAMIAQGAGSAASGLGGAISGIAGAFGSLFGDGKKQSPLDQLKIFSETKINAKQAIANAEALTAYGKAMAVAGAGEGLGGVGAILGSLGSFFAGKDAKTPLQKLVEFGDTWVDSEQVDKNAKSLGTYSKAMAEALSHVPTGGFGKLLNGVLGSIGSFFGVKAEPGPLEKMKLFGETEINSVQVEKNAKSLEIYSKAMKGALKASPGEAFAGLKGILGSIGSFFGVKKEPGPLQKMKLFGETTINSEQVAKNAKSLEIYSKAMAIALKSAPATGFGDALGGLLGSLGSFFGLKTEPGPLDKMKLFGETTINSEQVAKNANSLGIYSKAMSEALKSVPAAGFGGALGGLLSSVGSFFGLKAEPGPLDKMKLFGETTINDKQVDKNAKSLGIYSAAMSEALKSVPTTGFGDALGGLLGSLGSFFGVKKEPGPLDKLKTFGETEINSEQVDKNVKSLATYSKGMADAAKASPKAGFGDLMKGMLGSLAGFLGKKSPLEKMKLFSDMKINHKGVKDNVATFKEYIGMFSGQDTASKGIDALTESISKLLEKLTDSDVDTAVKNMTRLGQGLSYGRTRAVQKEIKKMNDKDLAIPVAIKGQVQVMKDAKLDEAGAKARGNVNIVNSYNNTTDASRKSTGVQNFAQPLTNPVAVGN